MKQLTRQEVEAMVERLADKTLNFGCMLDDQNHSPSKIMFVEHGIGQTYSGIQIGVENTYNFFNGYMNPEMKVFGHPITIGNVLEKMKEKDLLYATPPEVIENVDWLMDYWGKLGFSMSLQEIIEESGWQTIYLNNNKPTQEEIQVLKSPEANALFSFLQKIV